MKIKNKRLAKLYKDYISIQNVNDLNKRELTLAEYHEIPYLIEELNAKQQTRTFITSIAKYFERHGFKVDWTFDTDKEGVNYTIT